MKRSIQLILVGLLSQAVFWAIESRKPTVASEGPSFRGSEHFEQARAPASIDPRPFFQDLEDSITLYVVPPPKRLSWESPQSLVG